MIRANVLIDRTPKSLDEYIGNEKTKGLITTAIISCKIKNIQFGHMLITGRGGTGKTTLGTLIAKELNKTYKIVSAEAIKKLNQLNDLLINNLPDVLIMDEIHRLDPAFSDMMHQAMDDFKYSYADEDNVIRTIKVKPFILIGCTTDEGKLTKPFYSRFIQKHHLQLYTIFNLQRIIMNVARNNKIDIDNEAALEIATRSNYVPRNAIILFQNVYMHAIRYNNSVIDHTVACTALDQHEIDEKGLGVVQRDILTVLSRINSPLGAENLSQRVGIGKEALVNLYEDYLLSIGFIERTTRGRKITPEGLKYIQKK